MDKIIEHVTYVASESGIEIVHTDSSPSYCTSRSKWHQPWESMFRVLPTQCQCALWSPWLSIVFFVQIHVPCIFVEVVKVVGSFFFPFGGLLHLPIQLCILLGKGSDPSNSAKNVARESSILQRPFQRHAMRGLQSSAC